MGQANDVLYLMIYLVLVVLVGIEASKTNDPGDITSGFKVVVNLVDGPLGNFMPL